MNIDGVNALIIHLRAEIARKLAHDYRDDIELGKAIGYALALDLIESYVLKYPSQTVDPQDNPEGYR